MDAIDSAVIAVVATMMIKNMAATRAKPFCIVFISTPPVLYKRLDPALRDRNFCRRLSYIA